MAEKEDNVLTEGDNTSRNGEENFKEEIKVSKQSKRVEKERENYAWRTDAVSELLLFTMLENFSWWMCGTLDHLGAIFEGLFIQTKTSLVISYRIC